MEPFRYLEHTADVKFRACGHSLEELFGNAALAMFNAMTDTSKVECLGSWSLEMEAESLDTLLYEWLSELLYLSDVELALFSVFEVKLEKSDDGWRLDARIKGEEIDLDRHVFETEVKAVTLHQFEVWNEDDLWTAQVILDV